MWYEIWKGRRKKKSAKGGVKPDSPNHTVVGGVSVNSLCQQGGLFALSVIDRLFLCICSALWYTVVFRVLYKLWFDSDISTTCVLFSHINNWATVCYFFTSMTIIYTNADHKMSLLSCVQYLSLVLTYSQANNVMSDWNTAAIYSRPTEI